MINPDNPLAPNTFALSLSKGRSWFDKLTTNGLFDKLTTNGLFNKLTTNGLFDKAFSPERSRRVTTNGLFVLLLASASAGAGEGGAAVKAEELKAEPFRDAKIVGALAAGDKVEILNKDGGWFQVKSAKGSGWVHMLSIRRGEARKASAGSEVAGLAGLASGRAGTGRVVATTGIRGLDEEELKAAKYNEAEMKLAESYLASRAQAQQFAAKGKLTARKLDYLPDPVEGGQP